mmetsp:Transcript_79360/g.184156  ORF Transcript_79360/g.184156 Transcript_79360/m.184156 type:complete len:347 (+) Transcript_79360:55-1095(+)|eukprot:CAMPEP_0171102526 /NCGR_PEP_ID=MMETSP0766_2-20121228/58056_1 /TAXON_ID=439317 /ORGANISM="Gambierdiscus australes, Strain CAWD 149" /LENGTH=346 /DNA_ID=CAMNT_0011562843 /DNA_START=27 /DNA_END=1067 /DNA_ORIENTATION=-
MLCPMALGVRSTRKRVASVCTLGLTAAFALAAAVGVVVWDRSLSTANAADIAAFLTSPPPCRRHCGALAPRKLCSLKCPTAMRATTVEDIIKSKSRRIPKGSKVKYDGRINPKLRSLLGVAEYGQVLDLLVKLKNEGLLVTFLEKAAAYWASFDVYGLAAAEKDGGSGVANTVREDWERLWPGDSSREAFAQFSNLWRRLEQSRLFDDVMKDVLPDLRTSSDATASADQERLGSLDDDELRDEMLLRLQSSELVGQYAKLSKDDDRVQAIASDLVPFVGSVVAALERKTALQTSTLGSLADLGVLAAITASLLAVLVFVGVVKLPNGEDDALPPPTRPALDFGSMR